MIVHRVYRKYTWAAKKALAVASKTKIPVGPETKEIIGSWSDLIFAFKPRHRAFRIYQHGLLTTLGLRISGYLLYVISRWTANLVLGIHDEGA
jgi:hypothetical protein